MDEQRQNFAPQFRVAPHPLSRARCSFHHRVDRLEMARIGREADLHLRAILQFSDRAITEVIFHIAIASHQVGDVVRGKFGEDDLQRFLQEIRQNVEPAAVGHAHADLLDPVMRTAAEDRIQDDHERLRALKRKAFLPHVASVEKGLERLGFEERAKDGELRLARSLVFVRPGFQAVPDPVADARVLDVLKFRADRIGINIFEQRDHVAQRHLAAVEKEFRGNLEVEVLFAKSKLAQTEERILRTFVGQRIEPGDGVPEGAVSVDEPIDSRLERTFTYLRRGLRRRRGRAVTMIQIAQLESFKKCGPAGIERLRVLLPTPVIFLEQIEVQTGGERRAHGGFNLQGIREPGKLTVPRAFRYLAAK
jgi:hypothetical protein